MDDNHVILALRPDEGAIRMLKVGHPLLDTWKHLTEPIPLRLSKHGHWVETSGTRQLKFSFMDKYGINGQRRLDRDTEKEEDHPPITEIEINGKLMPYPAPEPKRTHVMANIVNQKRMEVSSKEQAVHELREWCKNKNLKNVQILPGVRSDRYLVVADLVQSVNTLSSEEPK